MSRGQIHYVAMMKLRTRTTIGIGRLGGRGCAMKTLHEVHEVPQGEDVDLHEPPHVVKALEGLVDPVLAEPLAQRGDPGLDRGQPRELDLVQRNLGGHGPRRRAVR